jgi:hypothetical protein
MRHGHDGAQGGPFTPAPRRRRCSREDLASLQQPAGRLSVGIGQAQRLGHGQHGAQPLGALSESPSGRLPLRSWTPRRRPPRWRSRGAGPIRLRNVISVSLNSQSTLWACSHPPERVVVRRDGVTTHKNVAARCPLALVLLVDGAPDFWDRELHSRRARCLRHCLLLLRSPAKTVMVTRNVSTAPADGGLLIDRAGRSPGVPGSALPGSVVQGKRPAPQRAISEARVLER